MSNLKNNREAMSNLLPLYLKNHRAGKVHSKFNKGLNVEFGDFLLYIGDSRTPLGAFGMNLAAEKLKELLDSVRIDDMVVNKSDKLIFYSICGAITIYKDIAEIDLKLPEIKCSIKEIADTGLYKYLSSIEFEKFIGIDLDEKTSKYVTLLLHFDKQDLNVNSMVINFFTGRGKGLTPSGDDMLLGFTLALLLFGRFNIWRSALSMGVTSEKTTVISAAYLSALLEGYISESFIRLVKLLDGAEPAEVEKTIKELQSFGHTSGNDTLFGFFLGLTYLVNQWEG